MATTYVSVAFNDQRIMDIDAIKKADGIPAWDPDTHTGMSRDMYIKKILIEKIDEKLAALKPQRKKKGAIIHG